MLSGCKFLTFTKQQRDSRRIPTDRLSKSSTNNCIVQQFACFFCYSMYFFVILGAAGLGESQYLFIIYSGSSLRGSRNERMRIAGLRWAEAAARAVLRTAIPLIHNIRYLLRGQKVTPKAAAVKRFRGRFRDYAKSDAFGTFEAIKRSPIFNAPSPRPPLIRNRFCRGFG